MTKILPEFESLKEILTIQPGEVIIGKIIYLNEKDKFFVDYPGNPSNQPLEALTTVPLSPDTIGREVALLFAEGNLRKPIIMGLIHTPSYQLVQFSEPDQVTFPKARLDGEEIIFSAEKEIVLQCGKASITLTRAGKILIRGTYVLSRSSGVNRIKGGSVQIN